MSYSRSRRFSFLPNTSCAFPFSLWGERVQLVRLARARLNALCASTARYLCVVIAAPKSLRGGLSCNLPELSRQMVNPSWPKA